MDLKLPKMLCKDSKQHHVMFHELNSVSSLFCIAQNVRFEIPYKDLYFETPFLMIFKYYAWASYVDTWPIDRNKVLSARQNIDEVQNFSARRRLRFVLHWNKTFSESWRRFYASLAVEVFSMWASKVAKNSLRRRCLFEIMPDTN